MKKEVIKLQEKLVKTQETLLSILEEGKYSQETIEKLEKDIEYLEYKVKVEKKTMDYNLKNMDARMSRLKKIANVYELEIHFSNFDSRCNKNAYFYYFKNEAKIMSPSFAAVEDLGSDMLSYLEYPKKVARFLCKEKEKDINKS